MRDEREFEYDVALSFAGEDRSIVEPIARCIRDCGVRVFYDNFEKTRLWGRDLEEHLVNVYMRWARYAVIFISQHYSKKVWTRHERKSVLARSLSQQEEYVLPIRIDETILDGLLPTIGYLDLRQETAAEVCTRICEKVGKVRVARKADDVASPWSPFEQGAVKFDYSDFNGRYRIGQGIYLFETAWSKASDVSIHCYNDPPSVRGVALAPIGTRIKDITDASSLDYTSRVRTPREGQVVVLENTDGFFAALQITDIKDNSRQDQQD